MTTEPFNTQLQTQDDPQIFNLPSFRNTTEGFVTTEQNKRTSYLGPSAIFDTIQIQELIEVSQKVPGTEIDDGLRTTNREPTYSGKPKRDHSLSGLDIEIRESKPSIQLSEKQSTRARKNWKRVRSRVLLSIRFRRKTDSLLDDKMNSTMKGVSSNPDAVIASVQPRRIPIDPHAPWKFVWDIVIASISLFESFLSLYVLGFGINIYNGSSSLFIISITILDCVLFVDIILKFLTAYPTKNFRLVTNLRSIAKRYLKSYFLIDLTAIIPFYLISFNLLIVKAPKAFYWLVLRNKIKDLFDWIRDNKAPTYNRKYLVNLFAAVVCRALDILVLIHLGICMLSFLTIRNGRSIFSEYGDESLPIVYLNGALFIIATMTGVGLTSLYDDSNSTSDLFSFILLLFFAIMSFVQITQSLLLDFKILSRQHGSDRLEMRRLKNLVRRVERFSCKVLPLSEEVKRDLQVNHLEKSKDDQIKNSKHIAKLPPYLKNRLLEILFKRLLRQFSCIFQDLSPQAVLEILSSLEHKHFLPNTIIFFKGNQSDGLYLIQRGKIIMNQEEEGGEQGSHGDVYSGKTIFGEECIKSERLGVTIQSIAPFTNGYFISTSNLAKIINKERIDAEQLYEKIVKFRTDLLVRRARSLTNKRRTTIFGTLAGALRPKRKSTVSSSKRPLQLPSFSIDSGSQNFSSQGDSSEYDSSQTDPNQSQLSIEIARTRGKTLPTMSRFAKMSSRRDSGAVDLTEKEDAQQEIEDSILKLPVGQELALTDLQRNDLNRTVLDSSAFGLNTSPITPIKGHTFQETITERQNPTEDITMEINISFMGPHINYSSGGAASQADDVVPEEKNGPIGDEPVSIPERLSFASFDDNTVGRLDLGWTSTYQENEKTEAQIKTIKLEPEESVIRESFQTVEEQQNDSISSHHHDPTPTTQFSMSTTRRLQRPRKGERKVSYIYNRDKALSPGKSKTMRPSMFQQRKSNFDVLRKALGQNLHSEHQGIAKGNVVNKDEWIAHENDEEEDEEDHGLVHSDDEHEYLDKSIDLPMIQERNNYNFTGDMGDENNSEDVDLQELVNDLRLRLRLMKVRFKYLKDNMKSELAGYLSKLNAPQK